MACYWGTCTLSLLSDVELILLRAAKIVRGLTEVNMETLKRIWQPLTNVYKLNLTSLMHSAYYGLIPKPICDLFHKTEQRPYNLRRRDGFKVPKYNLLLHGKNILILQRAYCVEYPARVI